MSRCLWSGHAPSGTAPCTTSPTESFQRTQQQIPLLGQPYELTEKRTCGFGVGAIVPGRCSADIIAGRHRGVHNARIGGQELGAAGVAVAVAAKAGGARVHLEAQPVLM